MDQANLHLDLTLASPDVEVVFRNGSTKPLRLWELDNSWGWWSISFQIRSQHDPHLSTIVHDWHQEWTGNAPSTFVLAPGEARPFTFNLNHGSWKRDQTIARLHDKPLGIRVSYHTEPASADLVRFFSDPKVPNDLRQSHERWAAEITSVFTGSAVSDWVTASPPHPWLFAPLPPRSQTADQLLQYPPEEVLRRLCALVDSWAWQIELDAKDVNEHPTAPLAVLDQLRTRVTVGHLVNSILEDAEEIRKAVDEARAYLQAKTKTPPEDGFETISRD